MIPLTASVLFASLLCLSFSSTRMAGVVGLSLLIFIHPLVSSALLLLSGAVFCFIHYRKGKK